MNRLLSPPESTAGPSGSRCFSFSARSEGLANQPLTQRPAASTAERHDKLCCHSATPPGVTLTEQSALPRPVDKTTGVATEPVTRAGGETRPRGHTERYGPAGSATGEIGPHFEGRLCKLCGVRSVYINGMCQYCIVGDDFHTTPDGRIVRGT